MWRRDYLSCVGRSEWQLHNYNTFITQTNIRHQPNETSLLSAGATHVTSQHCHPFLASGYWSFRLNPDLILTEATHLHWVQRLSKYLPSWRKQALCVMGNFRLARPSCNSWIDSFHIVSASLLKIAEQSLLPAHQGYCLVFRNCRAAPIDETT